MLSPAAHLTSGLLEPVSLAEPPPAAPRAKVYINYGLFLPRVLTHPVCFIFNSRNLKSIWMAVTLSRSSRLNTTCWSRLLEKVSCGVRSREEPPVAWDDFKPGVIFQSYLLSVFSWVTDGFCGWLLLLSLTSDMQNHNFLGILFFSHHSLGVDMEKFVWILHCVPKRCVTSPAAKRFLPIPTLCLFPFCPLLPLLVQPWTHVFSCPWCCASMLQICQQQSDLIGSLPPGHRFLTCSKPELQSHPHS